MFQAALIGVSGYGATYLSLLDHVMDRIRLSSAVIRNPAKCPETAAHLEAQVVRLFHSTEELYASGIRNDLVMIHTGIEFHEQMNCEALANGSSILVEKPAAAILKDVEVHEVVAGVRAVAVGTVVAGMARSGCVE